MVALAAVFLCTAALTLAQASFAGNWAPLYHEDNPERIPGPELGDYSGIPINAAARLAGDSYNPDRISAVMEYQCRPHGGDYSMRGLANMRVDEILDPFSQKLTALHVRMNFDEQERTIYLDGRPHPSPLAPHTWAGFSTGSWDDNMLNVRTTHQKTSYLRRNGLPRSDRATFSDHWVRHGNYLTITTVIDDPVYLAEPLVRSQTWILDPNQRIGRDVCTSVPELPIPGVPNFLLGANPFTHEFADLYGLPFEGTRGGPETIYPEYRLQMTKPAKIPDRCSRYCGCGQDGRGCNLR